MFQDGNRGFLNPLMEMLFVSNEHFHDGKHHALAYVRENVRVDPEISIHLGFLRRFKRRFIQNWQNLALFEIGFDVFQIQ